MNRYLFAFFVVLGVSDFIYGIFFKDRISVLIGGLIVFIAFYIANKKKKNEKDENGEEQPGENS
ncbi:MAG: hypothetical protein JRC93_08060 [Deltaproteobacteria bacterium]|nr:hypothetical protein [Deltaproteobacteria bacterium]